MTPNHLLQRSGAGRCDFMSQGFYNIFGSRQSALSAPVADHGRSAKVPERIGREKAQEAQKE